MSNAKISFVMPTYNRSKYIHMALHCFLNQVYEYKELIIVDDGTEPFDYPPDSRIRIIALSSRTPTGTKRNIGAEAATGNIILNLDDDDFSNAHRAQDQVQRLFKTRKAVTGYNASVLYEEKTGLFYKIPGGPPYFASGTSQCYWKSWWRQHPYPDVSFGEDSVFSRTARLADQLAIAEPGKMMVVRRHVGNTSDVFTGKLPKVNREDISPEFFTSLNDWFYKPHDCTPECLVEAQRQFDEPTIEYKVSSLPEVAVR